MVITNSSTANSVSVDSSDKRGYNLFLLVVAGLGGLLYGMDIGIIGGALPYLAHLAPEYCRALRHRGGYDAGRRRLHAVRRDACRVDGTQAADDPLRHRLCRQHSGHRPFARLCAVIFGRLLEGVSAGLIGVVIPLYLAECLTASERGKGTAVFQWLPTSSMVFAA